MAHETPPQPEHDDANERFLRAVELILQTLRAQGRFHTADVVQRAIQGEEMPRYRATLLRAYLEHDRSRLASLSGIKPPDALDKSSIEDTIAAKGALLHFLDQGDYDLHFMSVRDVVRLFGENKDAIAATLPEEAHHALDFTLITVSHYAEDPDEFGAVLERFNIPHSESGE